MQPIRCIYFKNMFIVYFFPPIGATAATSEPSEISCTAKTLYHNSCADYMHSWAQIWFLVLVLVWVAEGN